MPTNKDFEKKQIEIDEAIYKHLKGNKKVWLQAVQSFIALGNISQKLSNRINQITRTGFFLGICFLLAIFRNEIVVIIISLKNYILSLSENWHIALFVVIVPVLGAVIDRRFIRKNSGNSNPSKKSRY